MASKDRKNDTEDKKNKYCLNTIDCIDKNLSIVVKVLAALGVSASLLATISLIYYADEEKVSIFSHYSSWVSLLPVIASIELFIGAFLLLLVFFPAIVIYFMGSDHLSKEEDKGKRVLFLLHILVVVPPVFLVKCVEAETLGFYGLLWLLVIYSLLIFFGALYAVRENELRRGIKVVFGGKSFSFKSLVNNTFEGGILFIIIMILLSFPIIFSSLFGLEKKWGTSVLWVLLIVSLVLGFIYLFHWDNNRSRVGSMLLLMFACSYLFLTPFSVVIAKVALVNIGMGGGIRRVYYVSGKNIVKIPSLFIDNTCCDDHNFCLTEELSIKWAAGDLVYASLAEEENILKGTKKDKEKTNKQVVPKQTIALPRDILFSYSVDEGGLMGCKTQQKLIRAANKEKEGNK